MCTDAVARCPKPRARFAAWEWLETFGGGGGVSSPWCSFTGSVGLPSLLVRAPRVHVDGEPRATCRRRDPLTHTGRPATPVDGMDLPHATTPSRHHSSSGLSCPTCYRRSRTPPTVRALHNVPDRPVILGRPHCTASCECRNKGFCYLSSHQRINYTRILQSATGARRIRRRRSWRNEAATTS